MTDTGTPTPPPPPQAPAQAPQSHTTRTGTRALAITFGVLGGCVLLVGGAATAIASVGSTVMSTEGNSGVESVSANGVGDVRVDLNAGDIDIEFAGVDEAKLDYRSDSGPWKFERSGDTLVVSAPDWNFSLFDWGREQSATLTLPESLEGVDLNLDISAGELLADGEFGDITYELGAGSVELEGAATSVDGQVSAGSSVVELEGVRTASFEVAAGGVNGHLTGDAPDEITIDVSAGSVDLQLPDVAYDVTQRTSAGDLSSSLREDPSSSHLIDVRLAAGEVSLYAD